MTRTDYGEGSTTWEMLYKAATTTNKPDTLRLLLSEMGDCILTTEMNLHRQPRSQLQRR